MNTDSRPQINSWWTGVCRILWPTTTLPYISIFQLLLGESLTSQLGLVHSQTFVGYLSIRNDRPFQSAIRRRNKLLSRWRNLKHKNKIPYLWDNSKQVQGSKVLHKSESSESLFENTRIMRNGHNNEDEGIMRVDSPNHSSFVLPSHIQWWRMCVWLTNKCTQIDSQEVGIIALAVWTINGQPRAS